MPRRIEELMPYGIFIGLLLVLGNMAEGGELTAFRAAGVSPWRLGAALLPALLLVLLVNFCPERVGLAGGRTSRQTWQTTGDYGVERTILIESSTITPEDGVWLRRTLEDGQEYAHVGGVDNQGKLTGLLLYRIDASNRLVEAVFAASGSYLPAQEQWQLSDVEVTTLSAGSSASRQLRTLVWHNPISPNSSPAKHFQIRER